jgi:UDP-N-acetyl-D-mannosaminuronic acid transferase (WecB/TagA/CpsF family)
MRQNFQRILGIKFFTGDIPELLKLCADGHFIVAPAAPALAELPTNPIYRKSVEKSDFAVIDSSLMVILWKLFTGQNLNRISGPELLRSLLASDELRSEGSSVWIMPSQHEMKINLAWLNKNAIRVTAEECYVAPHYPKGEAISDPELLVWIEARNPRYIFINIGGGTQEPLGLYLKEKLCYRPSIICVGAAIAFVSGIQATIPRWADKCMLGWLCRCLHTPSKFVPRYREALRLIPILAKYRERSVATYVRDSETLSKKVEREHC